MKPLDASETCPCCKREFESCFDYPQILLEKVEVLPLPEIIDEYSPQAFDVSREQGRKRGLVLTEQLSEILQSEMVAVFLAQVQALENKSISPLKLNPSITPDRYFRKAYPVGAGFFVGWHDGDKMNGLRVVKLDVMTKGPSLGSAGGATLIVHGPIVQIQYRGLISK